MEADDLDNLITDSLAGVYSALEGERKAPPAPTPSVGEAVRDLQSGPARSDGPPGDEFFSSLVKTFQDEKFQKVMAEALQGNDVGGGAAKPASEAAALPAAASAAASGGSGDGEAGVEDFLQNFLSSFDNAVGSDGDFEKSLNGLMTSMLSNNLICEPLQQIADQLEPWLKNQKGLTAAEQTRYEAQLRMYKQILTVYRGSPDPLPEPARVEVQRMLSELHKLGQPPDEVMRQIQPKEAEEGGESFEDFMKSMGLDNNLGGAEQDLLKKLSEDPEELTKVMKDMAEGLPDEACKQQ